MFIVLLVGVHGAQMSARHIALLVFLILWPHVAYWRAQQKGGDRKSENVNVLMESVLGGVLMAALEFRLWPTAAMYFTGFINLFLWGGPRYALIGVLLSLVGLALAWPVFGGAPHFDTEPVAIGLSIVAIFSYAAMIGATTYRLRVRQRETREALEREERKSQDLLANVFPQSVIPRLRAGEAPIADQFADVTVVFADIVEFTPLAERLGPRRTVLLLNALFRRFDQAARDCGVEKIETTGDGYLAAANAPSALDRHPEAAGRFALALIDATRATSASEGQDVQIRIGIHTGPVFGGVVGESRFHYKIFGDTVNLASRVQSHSQPGRILVSEPVFKRIRGSFSTEDCGVVELKGHGPMRTYWLTGIV